jgi:hypothetical protein
VDTLQSITIPEGAFVQIFLQWDQPFASASPHSHGSANDLDIYLYNDAVTEIVASSIINNFGRDPFEVLWYYNEPGSGQTQFNIGIGNYLPPFIFTPSPGFIKYVVVGAYHFDKVVTINEYDTASGTIYGHSAAKGASAIGAAFYGDTPEFGTTPPVKESFSSIGPVPILFDVNGNLVFEVRDKPEIVAPDGTNTTFFGDVDAEGDGFPNFHGTSAAAPHAAAVAALMLDAKPDLTPDELYSALEDTAIDMHTAGFDDHTGHGFLGACEALETATSGRCTIQQLPEAPEPTAPSGEIATTTPEFIWTPVENATMYDLQVDDLTDDEPEVIRESVLTDTTFTPPNPFEDQKSYRWQVRAGNDNGWGPWSEPVEFNINITGSVQNVCDNGWIQVGTDVLIC